MQLLTGQHNFVLLPRTGEAESSVVGSCRILTNCVPLFSLVILLNFPNKWSIEFVLDKWNYTVWFTTVRPLKLLPRIDKCFIPNHSRRRKITKQREGREEGRLIRRADYRNRDSYYTTSTCPCCWRRWTWWQGQDQTVALTSTDTCDVLPMTASYISATATTPGQVIFQAFKNYKIGLTRSKELLVFDWYVH